MENKNQKDNKKEDLSPEELWKMVSQQLSSKKYENASKAAYTTMYDLGSLGEEIQKIRRGEEAENRKDSKKEDSKENRKDEQGEKDKSKDERTREKNYNEIENSILITPFFKEIEAKYPINKKIKVPSFFPKHSFMQFSNPNFYKKFDLDTLFFIFYYFKGTVQQTYAAIRLKHYAWRYHLKYKMWFQRLDEPKLITSEYEKGEFLFFDYETSWNFMKKNDFVFEYFYLEHNEYY